MKTLTFATLFLVSVFAAASHAADVLFSGTITSSNYSPAGSNLGTGGFWFANFNRTGGVNNAPPTENEVRQLPSYVTLSFGDTIDSAGGWGGYSDLTLPSGQVGNSGALEMNQPGAPGVAGTREDYLTLTFGAGAPQKLRLGVVIDNTDGLQFSNRELFVNNVSTGTLTNNLVADVKVFDIFNIAPGNTLVVEGISNTASVAHLGGFLLDPLNTIDLEVAANGAVRILPPATGSLDIKGYTITSPSGALNTSGWSGLESTALGNGNPTDGVGWEKLGAGLSTKVGEYNLMGSTIFGTGGVMTPQNLGSLYMPGGNHDLQFQFSLANGNIVNGFVNYVAGPDIPGDFTGNGIVDTADYVVWRKTNGMQPGYNNWRMNYGRTSGSGAALDGASTIPEPAGLVLLLAAACGLRVCRGRRKLSVLCLIAVACLSGIRTDTAHAAVTLDRDYRLGDEPSEGANTGIAVGSGNTFGLTFDSAGTSGAGDLQDLTPGGGSVTYTASPVRPGAPGRGVLFAGGYLQGDFEAGSGGLGYPGATPSPNGNPAIDYSGIITRGIQLWVNPTDNGARQEIINDTYQFGIHINANDTWGMTWGATGPAATAGRVINSTTPVSYGTWSHVHQHSYGYQRGVLYVNGVAVATSAVGNIYQVTQPTPGDRDITVGATLFTFANPFSGTMDDLELYVAGVSENTSHNYGTFDLGTDNDYIASLGLTQGDLNNDDVVNDADVDIFVDNWRRQQLLSGRRTGDINSRMFGDFDYDGFVGMLDWHVIRQTHAEGASLNLGALLAEAGVPEPGTALLLVMGGLAGCLCRRRRARSLFVAAFGALLLSGATAGTAHAANRWNVDFQGDTNSGGLFGQNDFAKNYGPDASGVWNHFVITALSANPQVNFSNNPSLNLVDNDGAASPVTVRLNGMYAGWNGAGTDHPLFGDYVIILGDGILGFPAPPLDLSITGLTPGTKYGLRVISGNVDINRDLLVTIDGDGNGSLANDTSTVAPSGGVGTEFTFTASASGGLIGTMDLNSAVEANLAGLQIKVGDGDFNPVLTINRETGGMTLLNNTDGPVNATIYMMESNNAGALNPAQWLSISDNYDASSGSPTVDPTSDWFELTEPSERDNLSEAQDASGNGITIADGQTINLGTPWIRSPLQDVTMQMLRLDGMIQEVTVRYTGEAPIIGDLNFDRDVDLADWALFKTGFVTDLTNLTRAERYGKGDFTLDGTINLSDANAFATAFDAMNGAGSFAALTGDSFVPEPTTAVLLLMGAAVVGRRGRRSATA
jgi:hypothetical protein